MGTTYTSLERFYQAFLNQAARRDGLRRLYVALTRAMQSLTVTLLRYVKHTQLARVIGADATGLPPAFTEACAETGVARESDRTARLGCPLA